MAFPYTFSFSFVIGFRYIFPITFQLPYTDPPLVLTENLVIVTTPGKAVPLHTVMAQLPFGPEGEMRHPPIRDKYRWCKRNG